MRVPRSTRSGTGNFGVDARQGYTSSLRLNSGDWFPLLQADRPLTKVTTMQGQWDRYLITTCSRCLADRAKNASQFCQ